MTTQTEKSAHRRAVRDGKALLPNTDPSIAEGLLTALYANPQAHPTQVVSALARQAPTDEVAQEFVLAAFELLLCREHGHLVYIRTTCEDILTGIRTHEDRDSLMFGPKRWPIRALVNGPPQSVVIGTSRGPRIVWVAADNISGQVIRQSEAIALANAMIERQGGRIIEDRSGPEVMMQSYIEANMTKRSKLRALALNDARDRLLKDPRRNRKLNRKTHARVLVIEAVDGCIEEGMVFHPESKPAVRYEYEHRVSDSWVILVAQKAGRSELVGPGCAWTNVQQSPPAEGLPVHWCFNEDRSLWDDADRVDEAAPPLEEEARTRFMNDIARYAPEKAPDPANEE